MRTSDIVVGWVKLAFAVLAIMAVMAVAIGEINEFVDLIVNVELP